MNSLSNKKFETLLSACKVICTLFWDRKGVILLDSLEPGLTINSDCYITTLTKLKSQTSSFSPEKKIIILLQNDSVTPHTSLKTVEYIANPGWTVLPQPLHSLNLKSSDFHLFRTMNDGLRGQHFPRNNAIVAVVKQWITFPHAYFYERGMQALFHHRQRCIANGHFFIEN